MGNRRQSLAPMPPINAAAAGASGDSTAATPTSSPGASTAFHDGKKSTIPSTTTPTSTKRTARYYGTPSTTTSTTPPQSRPRGFRSLGSPSADQTTTSSTASSTTSSRRRDGLATKTPATLPAATPAAAAAASSSSPTQQKPSAAVHRRSYTNFPPTTPTRPPPPLAATRITPESAAGLDVYEAADHQFHERRFSGPVPPLPKDGDAARRRGHARSSSSGAVSDGLRNLNRWSASTTSSRASNFTHFTRRSAEVLAGAFGKSRPSTSSDSLRAELGPFLQSPSPPLAPIPPLQALPPISSGPSLVDEVRVSKVLGPSSQQLPTRRPSNDPGLYWDGTSRKLEEEPTPLPPQESPRANRPMPAVSAALPAGMPYSQSHESRSHSHSRSRSAGTNGVESSSRTRDRERSGRPPSQKAMLSRALQKANTAVQLDNAGNIEGARIAYSEACALLQQVLQRTSGEEDRNKLEAIHKTYTSRIIELDELGDGVEPGDRELPDLPGGEEQDDFLAAQVGSYDDNRAANFLVGSGGQPSDTETPMSAYSAPRRPTRTANLSVDSSSDQREAGPGPLQSQFALHSAFSRARPDINSHGLKLQALPMDSAYIPPPLSPRRPISPMHPPPPPPSQVAGRATPDRSARPNLTMSGALLAPTAPPMGHQRANSHESVSWLDPIDESAGSSASSVHSRSSMNIKRRHIRMASGDTEAGFDAAMDDAIEAAYDDGYEPDAPYSGTVPSEEPIDPVANTLRRVEIARERVRESEREVLELANERERRLRLQQQLEDEEYNRQGGVGSDLYDGHNSDDEERFLEQMTSGYAIEDFAFGIQPRPPVPRESDSSGWTNRTWHSSMGSNPPTATTVLTTVSEHDPLPQPSGPLPPPPTQALPQVPPQPLSAGSQSSTQSVRNRRLSGQNAKQLKIETSRLGDSATPATAGPAIPAPPKSGSYIVQQRQALSAGPNRTTGPLSARPAVPSPVPGTALDDVGLASIPISLGQDDVPRSGSPSVSRPSLRKNFSSSSLRSMKSRNLSVSNIDEASDVSPGTPLSSQFGIGSSTRLPAIPSLPTPLTSAFKERSNSTAAGGLYLFDNQFHSPNSPGSPNQTLTDAPAPLEPCPNDVTLRPFWLMRCLYQTLCHPRGGYVSNKLFVPRDVWQVKGVKLKNLEDKVANCDLLTAALQKLMRVDTCDADAVLEEMQSFENVLEQVQATLTRRLGAEVGVQGSSIMFKDASGLESEASSMPRSASVAKKANSTSALWQRIRNKGSSANIHSLPSAYGGKGGSGPSGATPFTEGGGNKDVPLPSLPMTDHPTSRPAKRDIGSVVFTGPNATYMSSLARLFDAAQAVDQIARQVEDPGLKHADKTQVGIEFCTKHAAEFFCFFICRFVLSDMTLLLDKFIKRGSEWVLT